MPQAIRLSLVVITVPLLGELLHAGPESEDVKDAANRVLVVAGGQAITEGDLNFLMITRRVPDKLRPTFRKRFIEQLIDRRLMQAYLASRSANADPRQLDAQVARIHELIRKSGDDPQKVLSRLGYTEKTLRQELALPLSWKTYAGHIVTQERLRTYFKEHREEFDGTEFRASHILIKLPAEGDSDALKAAEQKLRKIRGDIVARRITFAEAAKKHSQAPSREKGGDVGFFPYRGKMPVAFTRVAFRLKVGDVSQPFRTPFGMHLLRVTGRKPGDLSLEDVRRLVFNRLANELWDEMVAQQRAKVKIEWKVEIR